MSFEQIKTILKASNHAVTKLEHQIDSFDAFMFKTLPAMIMEPPHRVIECGDTQHIIQFEKVRYNLPTVREGDGLIKYVTPKECKLRGMTYACSVLVDIRHIICDAPPKGSKATNGKQPEQGRVRSVRLFQEQFLCKMPMMVMSKLCHLRRNGQVHDGGGYFIVKGNEKVALMQEKMKINTPCVFPATGANAAKYALACEVRSWNEHKIRSTSTLNVYVTSDAGGIMPVVFVDVPFCPHGHIHLTALFKLLGCHDPHEMESYVLGPSVQHDNELWVELRVRVQHALASIGPEVLAMTTEGVLHWIVTRRVSTAVDPGQSRASKKAAVDKSMTDLLNLVHNEVLPHVDVAFDADRLDGDRAAYRCHYLGMMVRKLLQVQLKMRKKDDRDDFRNKRVETTGMNMALLFRQLYRTLKDHMSRIIKKWLEQKKHAEIITSVPPRITKGLKYALSTGNWNMSGKSKGASQNNGVAQVLSRINVGASLSHLRKLNMPLNKEGKMPKPRMLHHSHWGTICPFETPEGMSCGLMKNLAFMTHVRIGYSSKSIIDMLTVLPQFSPLPVGGVNLHAPGLALLYVNGSVLGTVSDVVGVTATVRQWRRSAHIPFDVTVALDVTPPMELHVNTDSGCLLRPLLLVSALPRTLLLVQCVPERLLWQQLLYSGCLEYVDRLEEEHLRVATSQQELWQSLSKLSEQVNPEIGPEGIIVIGNDGNACNGIGNSDGITGSDPNGINNGFTHVEIHPTMMMGTRAGLIPYSNHNQSPRNVYAAGMTKQAISEVSETGEARMDTFSHKLDTIQAPLVTTLHHDLLSPENSNIGQNVICAVLSYTGYNQEDSIIMNKAAIERGLFRSTFFRTYRDEEMTTSNDTMQFEKPVDGVVLGGRDADYTQLDSDGIVTPSARLTPRHVVIGKTSTTMPMGQINNRAGKGKERVVRDQSMLLRHSEDMVVDSVMVAASQKGARYCKVTTRATRIPEVGDKFSSRHSQKGVIGMVMAQEDLPFNPMTGMVPDIIINPHCMPSRMTMGHQLEALASKVAAYEGRQVDGTPFEHGSGNYSDDALEVAQHLAARLRAVGQQPFGMERLVNGMTGEMLEAEIFMCPIYYLKLKHMCADKLHARNRGPIQILTRQPAGGRARDGGLRIGEMERDCIVTHGAAHLLRDRLFFEADHYTTHVCAECGQFAQAPKPDAVHQDAAGLFLRGQRAYCQGCDRHDSVYKIETPFAFKLLVQELQAMHMRIQFKLSD